MITQEEMLDSAYDAMNLGDLKTFNKILQIIDLNAIIDIQPVGYSIHIGSRLLMIAIGIKEESFIKKLVSMGINTIKDCWPYIDLHGHGEKYGIEVESPEGWG